MIELLSLEKDDKLLSDAARLARFFELVPHIPSVAPYIELNKASFKAIALLLIKTLKSDDSADSALTTNLLYAGLLLGESTQRAVSKHYLQIKEGLKDDIEPLLKDLLTKKYCTYAADWVLNNLANVND